MRPSIDVPVGRAIFARWILGAACLVLFRSSVEDRKVVVD